MSLCPFYLSERDPVSIVQEVGWASVPVWTGRANLTSTGVHSSLYQVADRGSVILIAQIFSRVKVNADKVTHVHVTKGHERNLQYNSTVF
jgi:hypothetical protein